jgi:predicted transcriptional regulator
VKRSSPDIIATILEAANGGVGKTRLLTQANLTSLQFKKYMGLLLEKELLVEFERDSRHHSYRTTARGLKYLALYNTIKSVAHVKA